MKRLILFFIIIFFLSFGFLQNSFARSYWKRGMAIGAGSGAVVGGTFLGLFFGFCSSDPGETDFQTCGPSWGVIAGLGGAALGGLVGLGIGAAIGSAIKIDEDVALIPIISSDKNGGSYGLGLQGRF